MTRLLEGDVQQMQNNVNSIAYNADKHELKIITYYSEQQYTNIYLRDMFAQYCWYCLTKRDPYVRGTKPYSKKVFLKGYFLILALMATLLFLVFLVEDYSLPMLILFSIVDVFVWLVFIFFPSLMVSSSIRKAYGKRFSSRKEIQPTWLAVARGFVMRQSFRQEVIIRPDSHVLNAPYPGDPTIHSIRDQIHMRVLLSENDLYFLQLEPSKQPIPYIFAEALHFVKRNYTDSEWALLLKGLREMHYLSNEA